MFRAMDSEIRIALMHAMEERQELDHELLGPDHLLLGLLANVRGTTYQVLAEHGVTYEWTRRVVAEKHDDSGADPSTAGGDAPSNLDEDRDALKAIGIDLDKVRDAVRRTFGEDITDGWGQRRRRRGTGRGGPHGHGQHGHGRRSRDDERPGPDFGPFAEGFGGFGPWGRGRRGPRSRRFAQVTPSLRAVVKQVHDDFVRGLQADLRHGESPDFRASGVTAPRVLAAIFRSGDPVIDAVIEASDDPKALRDAVDELAGHATA